MLLRTLEQKFNQLRIILKIIKGAFAPFFYTTNALGGNFFGLPIISQKLRIYLSSLIGICPLCKWVKKAGKTTKDPFSVLAKKYKKKEQGYHIFHMDQGSHSPSVYRQLILMYYLNDVNEGGETEFYHQKIKIKPKQGRLVIFPAAFTHMHRGNPVISNKKYILNSWIVYN